MAFTSRAFGTARSRISRPTGSIAAPPMPCRTRAATRNGRFCASPHNSEPSVNRPIAEANTLRVPNRSAIHPLIGINTARLSV